MPLRCLRLAIECLNAHLFQQGSDVLTSDAKTLQSQKISQPPLASKWVGHMQLIKTMHHPPSSCSLTGAG